jgi:hypothetical protein
MITGEEKVKILDFGLAKALLDEGQSVDSSQSPTITDAMIQPGVVLGTAAYMSPEQAKGKTVDKRADIWAFGCILYECLAGKRAFGGETVTEALAAVMKEEPYFEKVQARARPLLRQCLAKDQKSRLRDIGDAMILLEGAPETVSESRPVKTPWLDWSMTIVFLLGLLVLGVFYFLRPAIETSRMISEVNTPSTSEPTSLAVSPDGRCLVYVASAEGGQQLWLRKLDEAKAQPLPGTEGATFPFWSPDSRAAGFFAAGQLKRIDVAGGLPVRLADAPQGLGGTWNQDDVIVFTPYFGNPLHRVSAAGGEDAIAVTQLNGTSQTSHNFPWFLPDGRHLLYFAWGAEMGIHLASLNSGGTKFLFSADSPAIYVHPGYLLFVFQGTLFATPFDAERGEVTGNRVQIADSVPVHLTFNHGGFSASETGLLAYRTRDASLRQLAWFDRSGNEVGKLGEPDKEDLANPELSPDGNRVAVDRSGQERTGQVINQIWVFDVARMIQQPIDMVIRL